MLTIVMVLVIRKMSIYALVLVQYGTESFVYNDPKNIPRNDFIFIFILFETYIDHVCCFWFFNLLIKFK